MNRSKSKKLRVTISENQSLGNDKENNLPPKQLLKSEVKSPSMPLTQATNKMSHSILCHKGSVLMRPSVIPNTIRPPMTQRYSSLEAPRHSYQIKNIQTPPTFLPSPYPHPTNPSSKQRSVSTCVMTQNPKTPQVIKSNNHHSNVVSKIPVQPIPNQYYLTQKPKNLQDQNQHLKSALRSSQRQNRRLVNQLLEFRKSSTRNNLSKTPFQLNSEYLNSQPIANPGVSHIQMNPYFQAGLLSNNSIIERVRRKSSITSPSSKFNDDSKISSVRSNMVSNPNCVFSELRVSSNIKSKDSESSTKIQSVISKIDKGLKEIKQISQKQSLKSSIKVLD